MTELKPCPFCGGEARIKTWRDRWENWNAQVWCINAYGKPPKEKCQADFFMRSDTQEKVIEEITSKWNTRPNPWHTGTPTEEGWYLIKYRGIYGRAIGRTEYRAVHRYTIDGLPMIDGDIGADDIWKPIEWQKIEEKEDGHTD